MWDVESGRSLVTLSGYQSQVYRKADAEVVYSAVFSPDGKRVVTASDNGVARVRAAESGHQGEVDGAVFSPVGKQVASADKTARVYIVGLDDLLVWAEKQLPKEVGP